VFWALPGYNRILVAAKKVFERLADGLLTIRWITADASANLC
jgi:hypothetical protein